MWIIVKEADLEQLSQKAILCNFEHFGHFVVIGLGEFDAIDPLRDQYATSTVIIVHIRNIDAIRCTYDEFFEFDLILSFVNEVELGIKALGPRFHDGHVIGLVLGETITDSLEELGSSTEDVEVFGY